MRVMSIVFVLLFPQYLFAEQGQKATSTISFFSLLPGFYDAADVPKIANLALDSCAIPFIYHPLYEMHLKEVGPVKHLELGRFIEGLSQDRLVKITFMSASNEDKVPLEKSVVLICDDKRGRVSDARDPESSNPALIREKKSSNEVATDPNIKGSHSDGK